MGSIEIGGKNLRDEVDKRKDELRELYRKTGGRQFDQTEVLNKKKGYHHRGVNKDPRRMAVFEAIGYEPSPMDDPESWTVTTGGKDESVKLYGEQVLMRIPLDKYIDNIADAELKQESREGQYVEGVREKMQKIYRDGTHTPFPRDITFDDSKQGPEQEKVILRNKKE
jgi:hypothetical protein